MDDLGDRLLELELWQKEVDPCIQRLKRDQDYRDRYTSERSHRRGTVITWLGTLAAIATLGLGVAAIMSQLLRLFGL